MREKLGWLNGMLLNSLLLNSLEILLCGTPHFNLYSAGEDFLSFEVTMSSTSSTYLL
jgi:hypothetical protein